MHVATVFGSPRCAASLQGAGSWQQKRWKMTLRFVNSWSRARNPSQLGSKRVMQIQECNVWQTKQQEVGMWPKSCYLHHGAVHAKFIDHVNFSLQCKTADGLQLFSPPETTQKSSRDTRPRCGYTFLPGFIWISYGLPLLPSWVQVISTKTNISSTFLAIWRRITIRNGKVSISAKFGILFFSGLKVRLTKSQT